MASRAFAHNTTGQAGSSAVVEAAENAISGLRAHLGEERSLEEQASSSHSVLSQKACETKKTKLTQYLPEPGYFLAGAVAGGVSRTATAPLDRLKVYLLVNTKTSGEATVSAAKSGKPISALKRATHPIGEAIASLYRSGGLRTFFAGRWHSAVLSVLGRACCKMLTGLTRQWLECGQDHARDGDQSESRCPSCYVH